jgi:Pyridoxamine 5'-phosphate oxidase
MRRWLRPRDTKKQQWRITVQPDEITAVLNRPISQELLARDLTRLAYVAKDGTPRNVPIGFTWNGSEIVMCTAKNAPKLPALRTNPAVALTIDTEVHPPKILLIRGRAELDVVDDIPEEYLEADRLRDDSAERGRGAGTAAGGASAYLNAARPQRTVPH